MQSGSYTGMARSFACFSASSRDLAEIEFTIITLRIAILRPSMLCM